MPAARGHQGSTAVTYVPLPAYTRRSALVLVRDMIAARPSKLGLAYAHRHRAEQIMPGPRETWYEACLALGDGLSYADGLIGAYG